VKDSPQHPRIRIARVVAVAGAITLTLVALSAPASAQTIGAAQPSSGSAADPGTAAVRAEDARVLGYWTPSRIAHAKVRDYVRTADGKMIPNAKPGGGSVVTGASWPNGGEIQKRSGRILFSAGGSDWICSGSVVNDASTGNGYSIVLTAGHCVYDGADGWSYNFLYMPNFDAEPSYDCTTRANGCWRANLLAAHDDFVPEGFGTDQTARVDYGFARVGLRIAGSGTPELDATTGGYGLNTASVANTVTKWAFGYPAAGRYKGKDLVYCAGPTIDDPHGAPTWGIGCNMTGGSSGGPWIYGATDPAVYTAGTLLTSVNSYTYSGLTYMFGPRFNSETQTVFTSATSGTASPGASVVCPVVTAAPTC
jgi:V8-like Glu-specific endopeptidase